MSSSLETLRELLDQHKMTVADLEYIVRYLIAEKISPQLAMRRIKSFDVLKQKMEDNTEKEVISELKEQLTVTEQSLKEEIETTEAKLQTILSEKSTLESEKSKLENMTDLFDSEREELRNQLKLLQEMQLSSEEEADVQYFKEGLNDLVKELESELNNQNELTELFEPLISALSKLQEDPTNLHFDSKPFINSFSSYITVQSKKVEAPSSEIVIEDSTTKSQMEAISSTIPTAYKGIIKQPEKIKQVKKTIKPKPKSKPKVDQRTIQVLDLFLDFLSEANDDINFQDRISSICEMDEAYEHLGSIGLSQVYSFGSKDISKKEELIKLLKTWKVEGVPH